MAKQCDWVPWLDAIGFCLPVVFPRIHMRVLHPVLLGEEHEGIHWPLAFCRRGNGGCPWAEAPVWFASGGLWGAGALEFITVWTDAGQGGLTLTGHAAEHIHRRGVEWGEVITAKGKKEKEQILTWVFFFFLMCRILFAFWGFSCVQNMCCL